MRILFGATGTTPRDSVISALTSLVGAAPVFFQRGSNYYCGLSFRLDQIDQFKDLTGTIAAISGAFFTVTTVGNWVEDFADFKTKLEATPSNSFVALDNHSPYEIAVAAGTADLSDHTAAQKNVLYSQIAFSMTCADIKTPYIPVRTGAREVVYLDHTDLQTLDISGTDQIVQDVEYRWEGDPSPDNYVWIWQADAGDPFGKVVIENVKFAPGLEIEVRKDQNDPGIFVCNSCDMTEGGGITTHGCSNNRVHDNDQLGNTEQDGNPGDYNYFWRASNGEYKSSGTVWWDGDVARTRVVADGTIPTRASYPAPTVNQATPIDGSEIYHTDSFNFDSTDFDHSIDINRFAGQAGTWEWNNTSSKLRVSCNFFYYVLNVWGDSNTFGDTEDGTRDGAIQREWTCFTLFKNNTFAQPAERGSPPRIGHGCMNWGLHNYSVNDTFTDCEFRHASNSQPNLECHIIGAQGNGFSRLYTLYFNVSFYSGFANTWAGITVSDSTFGRFIYLNKWNAGSGNIMRTGEVSITDSAFVNTDPNADHVWINEGGAITMNSVTVEGPCSGSRIYNKTSNIPDGGSSFTDVIDKGADGNSNTPVPSPPTAP